MHPEFNQAMATLTVMIKGASELQKGTAAAITMEKDMTKCKFSHLLFSSSRLHAYTSIDFSLLRLHFSFFLFSFFFPLSFG
jgi:hypothetical protein